MSLGLRVEDRLDGHSNYNIWKESKRAREISEQWGEGGSSLARIPRQHFSKIFQQDSIADLAHSKADFLARFLRKEGRTAGPYSRFAQISRRKFEGDRTTSGCTFGTHFEAEIVQQILWQLACFSRQAVQQHLRLLFGTKIEKFVQHLLLFLFCCLCIFRGGG